jgi:DNA-binding transcriptional LysR family regulator
MYNIDVMQDAHISGLDLKLVPALEALLRRRNVTHAAEELGLSQPAMSRALARLRDLQGDPLLVRGPGGYVLTPRAQALQPRLAEVLGQLGAVFHPRAFDPAQERRTLRLAGADVHTIMLMPGVAARLANQAPGVDLRVESYGPATADRVLMGELDLAFALTTTPLAPGAYSEVVAQDRLAVVMRRDHPAANRAWSMADYGEYPHAAVTLLGDGQSEMDAILAASGVTRRIALATPHFVAALAAVSATDMVTTMSAALAERLAPAFGLRLQTPPFAETGLEMTLVCSHIRASDPFLAWFRDVVRQVAREVGLGCVPGETLLAMASEETG